MSRALARIRPVRPPCIRPSAFSPADYADLQAVLTQPAHGPLADELPGPATPGVCPYCDGRSCWVCTAPPRKDRVPTASLVQEQTEDQALCDCLRCENCGKPMCEHDEIAHCFPEAHSAE